ncbi:MAG TPA: hypothetical protein VI365_07600 [Trebonia sp.]
MPCYRCGARQSDPERGPSPWKRGVVREHLVLVCPACQQRPGWSGELQSCARCGSLHLIRRLDQVECLDCCLVRDAARGDTAREQAVPGGTVPADGPVGDAALAAEVASALSRVLHRR